MSKPQIPLVAAALVAVALLAAACSVSGGVHAGSGPTSTAGPTGGSPTSPVPTVAEARQILARFSTNNSAANASLDTTLQNRNETGSAAAIDDEGYLLARKQGEKSLPGGHFSFVSPSFFIPAASGYPQVFWVYAASSVGGAHSVLVFRRTSAAGPWRVVYEPGLNATPPARLPAVALGAHGHASVVGASATGLRVAPGQLVARLGAYLSSNAKTAASTFAPGSFTSGMVSSDLSYQHQLAAKKLQDARSYVGDTKFGGYALRTRGGGALVVGVLAESDTVSLSANSSGGFTYTGKPGSNPLQLLYGPGPFASATQHLLEEVLAYDPPASGGAAVSILGEYGGFVSGTVTRALRAPAGPTLVSQGL